MAHALAMRATSIAVSAALLSLTVLIALSASYVVQQIAAPPDGTVITSVREPPPAVPDEPIRTTTPPPIQHTIEDTNAEPVATITEIAEDAGPSTPFLGEIGPPAITNPHWLERPRNLSRYYPRRALLRGVEGAVALDCIVSITGHLGCSVISEAPRGWGFGDAALRIAADHRMSPAVRDGAPVQGRYRMNVPFEMD